MAGYLSALTVFDQHLKNPSDSIQRILKHTTFDDVVITAIKTILVGLLLTTLRKLYHYLSCKLEDYLFPTAYIPISDPSFLWISAWLAQDPAVQAQIRDFQLSTTQWGDIRKRSNNTLRAGEGQANRTIGEHSATWVGKEIIGQVLPCYNISVRVKFQGNYLWIIRRVGPFAKTANRTVDHLRIRTFVLQSSAIRNFLVAAHQAYFAKEEKELYIFHALRIKAEWSIPVSRPARPWESVILPPGMKENLLLDVEKFLSEKEVSWYAARGIPHRRGYLFYGKPGAGKSTLATAVASKLRLDIYVINPGQRGMDDAKLSRLFRVCPARSILLIEDIDCIFPRGRGHFNLSNQEDEDEDEDSLNELDMQIGSPPGSAVPQEAVGGKHDLAPSTVTLSGLLNAIDGVSSQEGCILIASTNHLKRLDPALSRPGRFDVHIPFENAIPSQARALFQHFYPLGDFVKLSSPIIPPLESDTSILGEKERFNLGITCQEDIDKLADRFTAAIFEECTDDGTKGEVRSNSGSFEDLGSAELGERSKERKDISMAALQGYLIGFKEDPVAAVDHVGQWISSLRVKKGTRGLKAVDTSVVLSPVTPNVQAFRMEKSKAE